MKTVYILHAHRSDYTHKFIEVFTSKETLSNFLLANPFVVLDQVTGHEVDPK